MVYNKTVIPKPSLVLFGLRTKIPYSKTTFFVLISVFVSLFLKSLVIYQTSFTRFCLTTSHKSHIITDPI